MKRYILLFIGIIAVLGLCSCSGNTEEPTSTQPPASTAPPVTNVTFDYESAIEASATEQHTTEKVTETPTTTKPATTTTMQRETTTQRQTAAPTTSEATIQKTGEMEFSDNPDNRYINAIANKYGVESSLLVALYTVPENDSNIVLRFNGTKDANGRLIRNKDSLVAIYTIDKALNSKCASEDKSLNEYPYGEMKVMYFTTTKYIMPEFSDKL